MSLSRCVTVALVLLSLGGCSLLVGPRRTVAMDVEVSKLPDAGSAWNDFTTIEQAQQRLQAAARLQASRARNVQRATDSVDDLTYTALLGGAIGGATGSTEGARIGAGLAALLAIPPDRYQAAAQRLNLKNVAAAYQCLADTVDGLTTRALGTPILPVPDLTDEQLLAMNDLRYQLVGKVRRAAADIEQGFHAALENISITQPDLQKFEQSVGQQKAQENTLSQPLRNLMTPGPAVTATLVDDSETIEQKQRKIHRLKTKLYLVQLEQQELDPKDTKNKQKLDELDKKVQDLQSQISQVEGQVAAKLQLALTDEGLYTQRLLIQRLGVFDSAAAKCKAMVAAH